MNACEEPPPAHPMANHDGHEGDARDLSPPRKRAKLAGDDLRRRALEHKLLRAKTVRDKASELLCELFYLQAGGDMSDYSAWRKRPPAPALKAFLERRRPPPLDPPPPAPDAPPASPQEEIAERAKREAHVARRVAALARAGLWAERRLPRVLEPPRAKTHRDYLLEELTWLAQDFAHERKWKKQAARRLARACQRHLQDRAAAAGREERAREQALRRIASVCAREVRAFWDDAEKLARWRRDRRVDALRKRALDERLDYMVDRTEQYSRKLAAGLRAPVSDDEFAPSSGSEDDEETIAAADGEAGDTRAELEALRAESEMGLDAVLASLPPGYLRHTSPPPTASPSPASPAPASPASPAAESELRALAEEALALQPAGITLAEARVATPAPHLLRHTLREYQHVGLHWLATMHERRLNGILADEMGLGKTIQSIALLAHLALERDDWGPHLVVAPTSVVLNWEMEFKKWCPAFKILTYYGTIKERKAKRVGWTKPNSFHVCITSYKLVVQDHQSFRRKRWKYLILDEAQNIKNFKSQRWQTLLNFRTERRLLLTGTPLQNSLLELWSLMHFLMPAVFASHSEFREWFAPVAAADDAGSERLVRRLHALLRPFLLRRLKADVERQMPGKYEHVVLCRLSKRQRCLYDDFMGRARTRDALSSGRLLGVIDVLMQLRKVCNHPELFEARGVQSPLRLPALCLRAPAVCLLPGPVERVRLAAALGRDLASLEAGGAHAVASARARHLAPPRRIMEEPPRIAPPQPPAPRAELRLHVRLAPRPAPRVAPARTAPARPAPPAARTTLSKPAPAASPPAGSPHESAERRAASRLRARRADCWKRLAAVNERRCWRLPLLGVDLREAVRVVVPPPPALLLRDRTEEARDADERYTMCVGGACAPCPVLVTGAGAAWRPLPRPAPAPPAHRLLVPHPRLLQYDCGKLQALDRLLRRLRAAGHRVLIFTQMTRVLDVLEAFLCMHGHAYLRLDGATRVDRRQALVDRFNGDRRLFAMILSTRSGGVGLNLAGADTVVFYDSDWNPTMDAQAQDRAHRIGQTRDVHVYRLVSAGTVEENILRKAEQKRALGHRAIDAGRFTAENIRALLGADAAPDAGDTDDAELARALAAAEDEADAAAAAAAASERHPDEAEFDEREPEQEAEGEGEDPELRALLDQLTPVERYAVRVVESSEAAGEAERADLARLHLEREQWRAARPRPASPPLTYDAQPAPSAPAPAPRAQVWICITTGAAMPVWSPPTPPRGAGDVRVDSWARVLYRPGAAPDTALPAPRQSTRPPVPRRPRAAPPPAGLFERPAPRPRPRPTPSRAPSRADWTPREDAALRRALRLQRPGAAHPPNWEWCSELVCGAAPPPSPAHRGPRACRERHETGSGAAGRAPGSRRRGDEERAPWARLEALMAARARRAAGTGSGSGAGSAPQEGGRRAQEPLPHNPMHAALLRSHGIELHSPPAPADVAARRADRLARLKHAAPTATGSNPAAPTYRAPPPAASAAPKPQQVKTLQGSPRAPPPPPP